MTDLPDWHETIARLGRLGVAFKVRNAGAHIKVRTVNYIPSTGRVWIDGAGAFTQKGFAFLLEVLADEGHVKLDRVAGD